MVQVLADLHHWPCNGPCVEAVDPDSTEHLVAVAAAAGQAACPPL